MKDHYFYQSVFCVAVCFHSNLNTPFRLAFSVPRIDEIKPNKFGWRSLVFFSKRRILTEKGADQHEVVHDGKWI